MIYLCFLYHDVLIISSYDSDDEFMLKIAHDENDTHLIAVPLL
jgi:hypothetical protein